VAGPVLFAPGGEHCPSPACHWAWASQPARRRRFADRGFFCSWPAC